MSLMRLMSVVLFLVISLVPLRAQEAAQDAETADAAAETPAETIEIGLSTETVAITTDFSGETITIFGAADNIDRLIQRQGRYDIFLVMEGPRSDLIARRKGRVLGIWMNVDDQEYASVPQSYFVASTRLPRDITSTDTLERLGLNSRALRLVTEGPERAATAEFTEAVYEIKHDEALYAMFPNNIEFVSQSLFRAQFDLPANVPLGNHKVTAFLFRNGELVAQTQAPLRIRKAGIEIAITNFATQQPLWYGFACILLALIVGWLGRVIFRKD